MNLTDDPRDLDSLVNSAIAERGARPVPFGLHRKIENRIRLAALIQGERAWFVRCMATRATALALLLGAFGLTTYFAGGLNGGLIGPVPGGLGYLDYAATLVTISWSGALDRPLVLAAMVAMGVALLGVIPARTYWRNRFQ